MVSSSRARSSRSISSTPRTEPPQLLELKRKRRKALARRSSTPSKKRATSSLVTSPSALMTLVSDSYSLALRKSNPPSSRKTSQVPSPIPGSSTSRQSSKPRLPRRLLTRTPSPTAHSSSSTISLPRRRTRTSSNAQLPRTSRRPTALMFISRSSPLRLLRKSSRRFSLTSSIIQLRPTLRVKRSPRRELPPSFPSSWESLTTRTPSTPTSSIRPSVLPREQSSSSTVLPLSVASAPSRSRPGNPRMTTREKRRGRTRLLPTSSSRLFSSLTTVDSRDLTSTIDLPVRTATTNTKVVTTSAVTEVTEVTALTAVAEAEVAVVASSTVVVPALAVVPPDSPLLSTNSNLRALPSKCSRVSSSFLSTTLMI